MNPERYTEGGGIGSVARIRVVFQSAVFQKVPPQITSIVLQDIEVAQINVFPPNADPSRYYRDFGDLPTSYCGPVTINPGMPRYAELSEQCHSGLPSWAPACDEAVQELVKAYNSARMAARSAYSSGASFRSATKLTPSTLTHHRSQSAPRHRAPGHRWAVWINSVNVVPSRA